MLAKQIMFHAIDWCMNGWLVRVHEDTSTAYYPAVALFNNLVSLILFFPTFLSFCSNLNHYHTPPFTGVLLLYSHTQLILGYLPLFPITIAMVYIRPSPFSLPFQFPLCNSVFLTKFQ